MSYERTGNSARTGQYQQDVCASYVRTSCGAASQHVSARDGHKSDGCCAARRLCVSAARARPEAAAHAPTRRAVAVSMVAVLVLPSTRRLTTTISALFTEKHVFTPHRKTRTARAHTRHTPTAQKTSTQDRAHANKQCLQNANTHDQDARTPIRDRSHRSIDRACTYVRRPN